MGMFSSRLEFPSKEHLTILTISLWVNSSWLSWLSVSGWLWLLAGAKPRMELAGNVRFLPMPYSKAVKLTWNPRLDLDHCAPHGLDAAWSMGAAAMATAAAQDLSAMGLAEGHQVLRKDPGTISSSLRAMASKAKRPWSPWQATSPFPAAYWWLCGLDLAYGPRVLTPLPYRIQIEVNKRSIC